MSATTPAQKLQASAQLDIDSFASDRRVAVVCEQRSQHLRVVTRFRKSTHDPHPSHLQFHPHELPTAASHCSNFHSAVVSAYRVNKYPTSFRVDLLQAQCS